MIDNKERREVARKLRNCKPIFDAHQEMVGAGGVLFEFSRFDVERLADLIEPEPERTCHNSDYASESFKCSECGEITPYTLYWVDLDDGCRTVKSHMPMFCSNCGAKVVDE